MKVIVIAKRSRSPEEN